MAFVAIHTAQHNIRINVERSDVSQGQPVKLAIGDAWAYLSRDEAAKLATELLNAAEVEPVEVAA